jgi:hypothetical protein
MIPRALMTFMLAAALAGCTQVSSMMTFTGGPPPENLAELDGSYRGNATYARGSSGCFRQMIVIMTVTGGRARGEFRDMRRSDALGTSFEGEVDLDGSLATFVRLSGDALVMRGRFVDKRFSGELMPQQSDTLARTTQGGFTNLRFGSYEPCAYLVRLPRQAS